MPPQDNKGFLGDEPLPELNGHKGKDLETFAEETNRTSFEDALDIIGFGRAQTIVLLVSAFVILTVFTESMGMSLIMTAAQCDLDMSDSRKGLISSISLLGMLVSAQLWGYVADTRGRRNIMIYTMFAANACTVISSFSTNYWMFLVTRFFVGFFMSAPAATIFAYLGEFNTTRNRPVVIATACIFVGLGNIYIPLFGWLLLPQDWSWFISDALHYRPWRLLLIVNMIPGFLANLCLLKLPESGKYLLSSGDEAGSLKVLKWIYSVNTKKSPDEFTVQELVPEINQEHTDNMNATSGRFSYLQLLWKQTVPLFKRPLVFVFINLCFLMFGGYFTSTGIGVWFPEMRNRVSIIDSAEDQTVCEIMHSEITQGPEEDQVCRDTIVTQTFIDMLIFGVYYLVGYIGYAAISKFFKPVTLLRIFLFISGISGLAVQWIIQPIVVVILFSTLIIFSGFCIAILTGLVIIFIPTEFRGMAVCILLMFGRVGGIIGTNIVGLILEASCVATFYLYSGFILVCGVASFFLPNK